ncbi:LmbE-like protein [Punctularia strigosozonata HHB-11173 SS5]|uniref:LmbE-like protein n=1 Tax=Punctularia strigosozonata (strain HHB-11173) TaxID=741275 RepID=UPI0004417A60|nr:LmbE-like protein [Punctularia strigosozonata HHB-11173 SS5]EIN08188.1 LmbE-like protein [Punctularia strigosozonata HHB-11173 SS5]
MLRQLSSSPWFLLPIFITFLLQPLWTDRSGLIDASSDTPHSKRILLLTAHPDDECMFFAPTLLALMRDQGRSREVYSLCLSVGDADGLGETRARELGKSLDILGIDERRRSVVDVPELKDNFTSSWDQQVIADLLRPYVAEHRIDTILTFDQGGVSGHLNHASLPRGAAQLLSALPPGDRPRVFSLVTVPLVHKYIGPLAPLLAKLDVLYATALRVASGGKSTTQSAQTIAFVAGLQDYLIALKAMRQHWSQLVWFRWLYVTFSRYMWVNEWVPVSVSEDA